MPGERTQQTRPRMKNDLNVSSRTGSQKWDHFLAGHLDAAKQENTIHLFHLRCIYKHLKKMCKEPNQNMHVLVSSPMIPSGELT